MKIIGSDYDGTLNHGGIDEEKLAAIDKWRAEGNIFALISGRGRNDVVRIYNEKKFGCDYLIADNGAVILTTDGKIISEAPCDGSIALELIRFMFELGCPMAQVQTEKPFRVCRDISECTEENYYLIENAPSPSYFTQISTYLDDDKSAEIVTAKIRERFSDKLNPLQNGNCIDIVRHDMNKAKGLYILSDIVGCKKEDIIAVGDNTNDKDMIAEFRSYAMANGVDKIKRLADFITESVTELIYKELN